MSKLAFRIRSMDVEDIDFVVSSWTNANATVQHMAEPTVYEAKHRERIVRRTLKPEMCGLVATPPDEPLLIYGWAVGAPTERVVDYVFVKSTYRREGVARALVEALVPGPGTRYHTHLPARVGGNSFRLRAPEWRYDGYLFL
jgi:GNAT superfamily N-acetyltransferase